jgi:hypothetical protein
MTVIETKPSGLLKMAGGIAAAILVAFMIFQLTRHSPKKPAIPPTEFDGFVADSASRQLLRNAEISVTLGSYSAQQKTDTFGRYSIVFAVLRPMPAWRALRFMHPVMEITRMASPCGRGATSPRSC